MGIDGGSCPFGLVFVMNVAIIGAGFTGLSAGYSGMIPPTITPLSNVYLSNMEQVYPWDRGTNYAIRLGRQVARKLISS